MSDAAPDLPPWTHTSFAQQLVSGPGTVAGVGDLLASLGIRRAMLVTTSGRGASADGRRLERALGRALASTFDRVESHVPVPLVHEAVRQARRDGIDGVVSFGGGSCADLGKAVCFFVEQEQGTPGVTYADRPALRHVAVPTTYSGAEVTPFFGMTDPATHRKSGAGGPTIAPVAVVYDASLTLSTPARVSAETGMNALAHCVEAAWSPVRTPEAEAIALAGAARVFHDLPAVVAGPDDLDARHRMLAGSALAGRALLNASMGVHHGLAQLVGGRTGIPHGLANALILSHAIRYNADGAAGAVARLADAVGVDDLAEAIEDLRARLGLPASLREVGVTDEDLDAVAEAAPDNRNVAANPVPVSQDDARAILAAAAG